MKHLTLSGLRSYLWGMETVSKNRGHTPQTHSDPTYEAWKLERHFYTSLIETYSDPTYEAWKLFQPSNSRIRQISTPILPMRHGNRHTRKTPHCSCVLRSYLWGMETIIVAKERRKINFYSDPTYEAWKHLWNINPPFPELYSDPTYEAWKL